MSPCINSNLFHFPPSGHFGLTDPVAWIMSSGLVISTNERPDNGSISQSEGGKVTIEVRPEIMEKDTGKARNLSRCPPCNDRIIAGLSPTATRENSQSVINLLIFMSYFHQTRGLLE